MTGPVVREASSEIAIDRVPAPSQAEFEREFLRASRPAIFTDVVPGWRAWGLWSRDYFRRVWGDHKVPVMPTRGRYAQYDGQKGYLLREMPMAEALDRLDQGGEEGVYPIAPLDRYLHGLLDELDIPVYCKGRAGFRSRLWISAPDIGVPLHRDFSENLIGQLVGIKQLVVYPPEEWHHIYAFQRRSPVPTFCGIDGEAPDLVRFPRSAHARRVVITLRAGEMLFLPSRWWHQVRSVEPSINVNFWWAAGVYEKMIRLARTVGLAASV